jgi:hypothetical protein
MNIKRSGDIYTKCKYWSENSERGCFSSYHNCDGITGVVECLKYEPLIESESNEIHDLDWEKYYIDEMAKTTIGTFELIVRKRPTLGLGYTGKTLYLSITDENNIINFNWIELQEANLQKAKIEAIRIFKEKMIRCREFIDSSLFEI